MQRSLRDYVVTQNLFGKISRVAGIDVGFEEEGRVARAAVAVLAFPSLEFVQARVAREAVRFPYVPGLLSFREIPVVVKALRKLSTAPDLLLCDGQGYAHPRRFGLACHLGVLTDTPAIGVAKSRLIGHHGILGPEKGTSVALTDGNEVIGAVLRTRAGVRPLYISLGHRVSLTAAVRFTLACATRYRLPETTRWAHRLASSPGRDALYSSLA